MLLLRACTYPMLFFLDLHVFALLPLLVKRPILLYINYYITIERSNLRPCQKQTFNNMSERDV